MDISLHYTERGSGASLILLHGNGENLNYFKYQLDFFAPYFRVIAVDTRGHGRSPRGQAPFTLSQFAEDLKAFMDGLGIAKAHILGFSDGGNIAMLFALRYPDRVDKLILNGANLRPSGVRLADQLPVCARYGRAWLASLFDKNMVPKKEMLGLMVRQPNIRRSELGKLNMPVLVIAGTRDMIRVSHTRKLAAAISGAELCLLDGDHFIARRQRDAFNRRILEFLQ